jgi:hypothetical protein
MLYALLCCRVVVCGHSLGEVYSDKPQGGVSMLYHSLLVAILFSDDVKNLKLLRPLVGSYLMRKVTNFAAIRRYWQGCNCNPLLSCFLLHHVWQSGIFMIVDPPAQGMLLHSAAACCWKFTCCWYGLQAVRWPRLEHSGSSPLCPL